MDDKPIKGEHKHLHEWVKCLGIPKGVLLNRLKRGWSVERAFTQPIQEKNR